MRILVAILVLIPGVVLSQGTASTHRASKNSVDYFLKLYSQSNGRLAPDFEEVDHFVAKLELKKANIKSEKAFLHHIFVKTHQQFLNSFREYASFSDLIEEGTYNCLTATSLYGILFDHFNISFRIIETNEHIFMLCSTRDGQVLLETTDYENGFVDSPLAIEKKLLAYVHPNVRQTSAQSQHRYTYTAPIADTVDLTGMLGLLHYNHAAKAYNQKDFSAAITHLHHAYLLHHSPRMEQFAEVMLLTIRNQRMMDPSLKEDYVEKILALRQLRNSSL